MKTIPLLLMILLSHTHTNSFANNQSINSILVSLISEGDIDDRLGYSLAVDENTAMIGSRNEVVKVFDFDGENWVYSQDLSDLGLSISISGDIAFLGDPHLNNVYIYHKINNNWQRVQSLHQDNPDVLNGTLYFGWSVTVSEEYAVVGTNNLRVMPLGALVPSVGYAYVYKNIEGVWNRVLTLPSESGSTITSFGINVELENDKLLISSNTYATSKVYSYLLENDNWILNGELDSSDPSVDYGFGSHVEISGNQAVISSWRDAENYQHNIIEGSAFVFKFENNEWTEKATLKIDNTRDRLFGYDVQINGNNILISEFSNEDSSGKIHIFNKLNDNRWLNTQTVSIAEDETFGWALGLSNDQVIVGSPADEIPDDFSHSGSAYSFTIELDPDLDPLFKNGFE